MTSTIIIIICILFLVAYIFDITAPHTRIPAVILLLLTGFLLKQAAILLNIQIPDLSPALPVAGTVGLILIVMEGALDLEINRRNRKQIFKISVFSLTHMLIISVSLTLLIHLITNAPFHHCLINAIPLSVISSAIAIPAVRHLSEQWKEFITYESSLSDILGVLIFNFLVIHQSFHAGTFAFFGLQLALMLLISLLSIAGLSILMNRIQHPVKFIPIILLSLLIYSASKIFHLPALIFILLFGLFLSNIEQLKEYNWVKMLKPENLQNEVRRFKEIIAEISFVVRVSFFLIFGFLIDASDLFNMSTLGWAITIMALVFGLRWVQLKYYGISAHPLLFIAPRGLITLLLFMSIPAGFSIVQINSSLLIQIVVLSALMMMAGMIKTSRL